MAELRVTQLHKAFGGTIACAGVDLTVPVGSLTAVLGPSGCGKTTLLRCVAGFELADSGSIHIGGKAVTTMPPHRRRVAIVPQDGALFPHLSVAGNVGYGLGTRGRADRIREVLALVGLTGLGERMPHQLSGGQQQRVAVARALAPRPPLVLLDEPFSALDAALRGPLRADVRDALRADGATAVLVTHDQGEALAIADQVVVMRDGRVVQSGSPGVVYRAPADSWVAGFVGEAVLLACQTSVAGQVETVLGRLSAIGQGTQALVRPEQIAVVPARTPGTVPATVSRVAYHGHDVLLTLRLGDGTPVQSRILGTPALPAEGDEVGLRVHGDCRLLS